MVPLWVIVMYVICIFVVFFVMICVCVTHGREAVDDIKRCFRSCRSFFKWRKRVTTDDPTLLIPGIDYTVMFDSEGEGGTHV